MPKKNFLISMDIQLHEKLKAYAKKAEVSIGDAVGMLVHSAENKIDLEMAVNPDQKPQLGKFDSLLYRLHLLTVKSQTAIYENDRIPDVPRPYLSFGKKPEDIRP